MSTAGNAEIVENWLTEKMYAKINQIRNFCEEKLTLMGNGSINGKRKILQEFSNELGELGELVLQEESLPDVVQKYLLYFIDSLHEKFQDLGV